MEAEQQWCAAEDALAKHAQARFAPPSFDEDPGAFALQLFNALGGIAAHNYLEAFRKAYMVSATLHVDLQRMKQFVPGAAWLADVERGLLRLGSCDRFDGRVGLDPQRVGEQLIHGLD